MKRITAVLLALIIAFTLVAPTFAAADAALDSAISDAAAYILKTVQNPEVGSVGGEWAVIGLARSGYAVPDSYYETYYKTVEQYIKDCEGVLHDKKYTEYSRVILGLTAAGYDPRDVGGYDLTLALGDFSKTVWQGINGPIFALIALDSGNYPIPNNPDASVRATRDMYIDEILRRQLGDGGWNLSDDGSNPSSRSNADLTGMVLQALSRYQDRKNVKDATDKALEYLSKAQDENGGYPYGSSEAASESTVQVLVAITALGVSVDDPRFVKNGNTLVDNLLSLKKADGSYRHTSDGSGNNQMSTEQVLYGLAAARRARDGKNNLYAMSDAKQRGNPIVENTTPGLPGKHADVKVIPISSPGRAFSDVVNHENKAAIQALAERGIINGKTENAFDPDATMRRAEFAAIIMRGLGLAERTTAVFTDVSKDAWYAGYVGAAYHYEIITGTSATTFNPIGTITKQEAAVMIARAAKLVGMDTEMTDTAVRDMLAQFGDYTTAASWARPQLAFCYSKGFFDDSAFNIEPLKAIRRCEIAEVLYRLLNKAELLK